MLRPLRPISLVVGLLALLIGGAPSLVAQEATPPDAPPLVLPPGVTVVASGLTNPRGMTWGADGTLFVALAGSGGPNPATEEAPTTDAIGPWFGGPTAAVVQIGADGCPIAVVTGLPSTVDSIGGVLGADDVAILGDHLYAAVDGGGPVHGNPDAPSGVYRILADGTTELVADLSAWVRANPVAEVPGDFDPDAAGYAMVADAAAGLLWVGDPNSGQILTVTPDGAISRVADLSVGHPVPTKLALAPEGGVYVGMLTVVPYPDGAATVVHVAADGTVTEVWSGLTTVTDVAVGPDGSLYATELSTGNLEEPPFLVPGSGRVVRQVGPDQAEVVADGLMLPIALAVGPDDALYVSLPAIGADAGDGVIIRLAEGVPPATPMADGTIAVPECAPIPETLAAAPAPDAEAAEPEDESAAVADETVAVTIENFAFDPPILEVTAGTTVTWTNADSSAHTATATDGSFDTGNLDADAGASVTFDTPGTYDYVCTYHPNMQGTIIVT